MDGPETPKAKAEGKGESAEAAAEIEADGRRKELQTKQFVELVEAERRKQGQMIVEINEWSRLKSRGHFFVSNRCFERKMSDISTIWVVFEGF